MFNNIRNRKELYCRFATAGFKIGCEVGVHKGQNALVMFQNIPGLKLYLVEPYADHKYSLAKWGEYNKNNVSSHENARVKAHNILRGYNAEWLQTFSEDAARSFPDGILDFVYIDGEHAYDFVMLDIILWTRKVKPEGIVSGHDYDKFSVESAVRNYVKIHELEFNYTQESKSPSWYFIRG